MGNKNQNNQTIERPYKDNFMTSYIKRILHNNFILNTTVKNGDYVNGNKSIKIKGGIHIGNVIINVNYIFIIVIILLFFLISKYCPLEQMNGDLNIAVIPLIDENIFDGNDFKDGISISNYIYNKIPDKLNDDFEFDKAIDNNLIINLMYRNDLEKYVEQYANRVNAHIVIYGYINKADYSDLVIDLKIYISPKNFYDIDELLGEMTLGSFFIDQGNLSGLDIVGQNQSLRNQIEILTYLIKAFGALKDEDFKSAEILVNKASDEELWSDNNNGLELVYLLKGNIIFSEGSYYLDHDEFDIAKEKVQEAKKYYEISANIVNDNQGQKYARAYLGLAGIESFNAVIDYFKFGDICMIDRDALKHAEEYLLYVNLTNGLPDSTDIYEKSSYLMAQIKLTEYLLSKDEIFLAESKTNYFLVINSYENGNERIIDIAAKSYAGLATIETIENSEEFEFITENYESAINLSENPRFKAIILIKLGEIFFDNEDMDRAVKAFENAKEYSSHLSQERINYIDSKLNSIRGYNNESK